MSSSPPIFYWRPGTVEVLERVRSLRARGVDVCATIDAGPNVHLICTPEAERRVVAELSEMAAVQGVIQDRVGAGPRLVEEHLI